jgi:Skp family chaperone for outer membrane proteins
MKAILSICLLGVFSLLAEANDLKIATVDLSRVLTDYDKAKEAMNSLKLKEVSFRKELEGLRLEGQQLLTEVNKLQETATESALSAAERAERRKRFESKFQDLESFRMKYDQVRAQKEEELKVSLDLSNKQILEQVVLVTRTIGDKEGFNLVLNANKINPAAGDVVFSKGITDLTDKVLTALNSSKKN